MDPFKEALTELCQHNSANGCCRRIHIASMIRLAGSPILSHGGDGVVVDLDWDLPASRIDADVRYLCGRSPSVRSVALRSGSGVLRHFVELFETEPEAAVLTGISSSFNHLLVDNPRPWLRGRECCSEAFWRGALVARGRRRRRGHHAALETHCPDEEVAKVLVSAAKLLGIRAQHREEYGRHLVVVRSTEKVSTLLDKIGAPGAARRWETTVRPLPNARNTIAEYNVERVQRQATEMVQRLHRALEILGPQTPDLLRGVAEHRIAHPELSIAQLASLITPRMSRSTLTRHLHHLFDLADEHALRTDIPDISIGTTNGTS